jgi:hypothetical protein
LWVEGILDLTNANQTGNFGNGQPYWQFNANEVWPQGFSGPNIEVSQVSGLNEWKIYAIDSVQNIRVRNSLNTRTKFSIITFLMVLDFVKH